jgi:hypothetical protein
LKKKFFTDRRIELIIRFWSAGAVYLFVGWGTGLGQGSLIDFIFILGTIMAIFEMFVVNPLIRRMLNVKSTTNYLDTTIGNKVLNRLGHIFKTIFIMAIVATIYIVINQMAAILFNLSKETVAVPGEPILFGLFYLMVYKLIEAIRQNLKKKTSDVKE